jgi:radical SAM protein with 4Fe4S-binding SPASM domain
MTVELERADEPSLRVRRGADVARHTPVHVVWELTLACNLRCVHCGSRAGRPRADELNTEECLDIVRQLAALGTREITLIGGEAYLRRDWLTIAKAIANAGIHCGIQSGGRAFTEEKIRAAIDAGVRAIGVSIDGPPEIHDRLRGVKGSYDQALKALRAIAKAGIQPGVNTQVNALSKDHLRTVYETIVANGAKFWQVQLTVAMGNAVDNAAVLLQPHDYMDAVDVLAELFERGLAEGLRMEPGNSIGYFGPYEAMWRSLTADPEPWSGCTAGETTLGLEADGKIKGCPSLPADPYMGGMAREMSIAEAMAALAPKTVRRDGNRGRGFCGSCYYWSVCRGGCSWVTHSLTGKRGDNPYCYYRARTLAGRGYRERIVKVREAPGHSFDIGRFEIVVEDRAGKRVPRSLARDDKKRPRSQKLALCTNCHEYLFASEGSCPHCHAPRQPGENRKPDRRAEPKVQALLDHLERQSRLIHELVYGAPAE